MDGCLIKIQMKRNLKWSINKRWIFFVVCSLLCRASSPTLWLIPERSRVCSSPARSSSLWACSVCLLRNSSLVWFILSSVSFRRALELSTGLPGSMVDAFARASAAWDLRKYLVTLSVAPGNRQEVQNSWEIHSGETLSKLYWWFSVV